MDLSPASMMASDGEDDTDLEAEFLAIVGGQPDTKRKPNGKSKFVVVGIASDNDYKGMQGVHSHVVHFSTPRPA